MRWYINDASLQGQFADTSKFLTVLDELLKCRNRFENLRTAMHLTRSIADRPITPNQTLRQVVQSKAHTELRRGVLLWLDRRGPFMEDDRRVEVDDYFECKAVDVTETGLGEAARRVKAKVPAMTYSFPGGKPDFGESPLCVQHGLREDPIGEYLVDNVWDTTDLVNSAVNARPVPVSWEQLVLAAREQFPRLLIPDDVFVNSSLSKEPFEGTIAERALALLNHLDAYMVGRANGGAEGAAARAVIDNFFTGDRALFSGESTTNQDAFRAQMSFPDPDSPDTTIFAHWHGKISHRFFRLHFEWPLPPNAKKLKVLYLGPKLTKK